MNYWELHIPDRNIHYRGFKGGYKSWQGKINVIAKDRSTFLSK